MIGLLLTFCFLFGLALIALGFADRKRDAVSSRIAELWRRGQQAGILSPRFVFTVVAAALVGSALGWALTGIPVLAILGGFAGGYPPVVLLRPPNEHAEPARERAWAAALAP